MKNIFCILSVFAVLSNIPLFAVEALPNAESLARRSLAYHCVQPDAKPSKISFDKLPSGAEEFEVLLPAAKNGIIVNAADFGLNREIENAATVINRAIAHCKKIGASKLVVNRGIYKCFDAVPVCIENASDFTLDFCGSTLVYYSKSIKAETPQPQWDANHNTTNCDIKIRHCRRVKICNVKLDWDWRRDPLAAFVEIVGKNANAKRPYADLRFFQYDKYPTYGKRTPIVVFTPFYKDLSAPDHANPRGWFGAGVLGAGEGVDTLDSEWIEPNKLRVYFEDTPQKSNGRLRFVNLIPLNSTYRITHYYYGKNGIDMFENSHLTLENIDILSCRGHALHVDGQQQYWQYINVNVAPPEGDARRAISSTADHHHVANSKGFIKLVNCKFSLGMDDGANFHDRSYYMKKAGEKTLESANVRGVKFFAPQIGEEIELFQDNYVPAGFKAKIAKIDGERIVLDRPLPTQTGQGFVCFKTKYGTRNIIIRNCRYVRHTCRGILMLAKDVTIENCLFEREEMGALKFETGYTERVWCEGYGVDNVVVRNCVFRKCNIKGAQSQGFVRDIMLAAYMRRDPSEEQPAVPVIKNLLFENNRFCDMRGLVALISSSQNVIFRNNSIECGFDYNDNLWYRGAFVVQHSKNVFIVDNTFAKKNIPMPGVFEKNGTVENLVVAGNRLK